MEDARKEELWRLLAQRNEEPGRAAEIDEIIWRTMGTECAVLVSDLSGFTRLTKSHGILHFLSLHRRSLEICLPEVEACGGIQLKTEADNMIVVFPEPGAAVDSAIRIMHAIGDHNNVLDESQRIGICLGISSGPVIRTDHDAFGDAINVAYKLGEDVAKVGEILVCDSTRSRLADRYQFFPRQEAHASGIPIGYHRVRY